MKSSCCSSHPTASECKMIYLSLERKPPKLHLDIGAHIGVIIDMEVRYDRQYEEINFIHIWQMMQVIIVIARGNFNP